MERNRSLQVFVVFTSFIVISVGQLHVLKYISTGAKPTSGQFNSSTDLARLAKIGNELSNADRICLNGMWALYNTSDFGEGVEDTTTVISGRGTTTESCTAPGQLPQLQTVRSVRYLGSANYSEDGVNIFTNPYLLGGMWNVTDQPLLSAHNISGVSLGSIAITGLQSWLLCGDRECRWKAVCVNMKNFAKLFLQRNTATDSSVSWPKIVRNVRNVTADECGTYPNPASLNSPRAARSSHRPIDIFTSA